MRIGLLVAAAAVTATTQTASASESYTVRVPVVSAEPVVSRRVEHVPREDCRPVAVKRRHYRSRRHRENALLPTLVGGLIGGAIGHQFGGGSGKDILTVVGAFTGANLANESASRRRDDADFRHTRERCVIAHERRDVEVVTAWRVTYLYRGREFTRTMDRRPGTHIRLHVDVEPAPDTLIADSRSDPRFL